MKFFLIKLKECDDAIEEARKEAGPSSYETWLQGYRCAVLDCLSFFDADAYEAVTHEPPGFYNTEVH